ncbi:MAG: hypothetical protein U1F60_11680 [Planctomycetota bacterium]
MKSGAVFLLLVLLPGCAFARRENRPVWNAFESHLVPDDPTAFALTLPLTVPGGLLAILTDTFAAHPIQAIDDAWHDAAWLWRDGRPDYAQRYYSEVAFTPVRVAITPVVFAADLLGRSLFDVEDAAEREAYTEPAEDPDEAAQRWLAELADGGSRTAPLSLDVEDRQLRARALAALPKATALGRLELFRSGLVDPLLGLQDEQPAVRAVVLLQLAPGFLVPDPLIERLLVDPDPIVRELAQRRWPPVRR